MVISNTRSIPQKSPFYVIVLRKNSSNICKVKALQLQSLTQRN